MDEQELKDYLHTQLREIFEHRWIESEKAGMDLGEDAVHDWIVKHAKQFREWWEFYRGKNMGCQPPADDSEN